MRDREKEKRKHVGGARVELRKTRPREREKDVFGERYVRTGCDEDGMGWEEGRPRDRSRGMKM